MGHQVKKNLGSTLTNDGVEFRVWAPFAKNVSVLINDSFSSAESPLLSEDDGYWAATIKEAEAGQSYKYRIYTRDDQILDRNDPRAEQLTDSDIGASVIVDPRFDWEGVEAPIIPKEKQVIYELHIGTFNRPDASTSGTFATAIEKLDYLQNLGITTIELMPVTSMKAGVGWGYEPMSIYAVEDTYGGRRGLLDFVKACHKHGIAVILDVVYNHFYDKTDLRQFDGWSENGRGGIYFYNDERGDTPWGMRPDYGRPEVRQYLLDNVAMWLTDYRVDGLRLDSTTYMRNTRGPEGDESTAIGDTWTLLQEMTTLAHKINPHALMIAEDSSGNESITKPVKEGGTGFDAQWGISFPQGIRQSLGLSNVNSYNNSLDYELSLAYNGDAFQKVIFGDSHDTAANGAVRLNEAVTPGNAASVFARQYDLIANAIALTAPGIPMILQGEEFLQEGNFNDWKMLEWDKTTQFAGIVLAHQHLINLRKNTYGNTTGLTGPSINIFHEDISNHVMAYHRWRDGGAHDDVLVIINCSDQRFTDYKLYVPVPGLWHVRFNSSWKGYSSDFNETKVSSVMTDENSQISIELADFNIVILTQDPATAET
ncbi:MAG: alpha-amylase family glycosyl hydrolase [Candidatus Saccharimonadales bacterium]